VEPWGGTDGAPEYPSLTRVAATARRWWWALLLGAVAGAALALVAGGSGGPTYRSSVRMLVGPIGGEYSVIRAAGQQAQTYADLATSRPVLDATLRRLHSSQSPDELRRNTQARANDVTRLLTVTVKADRAAAAAGTANALAAELQRVTHADEPIAGGELRVIDAAQPPAAPATRRATALVFVAALAGLLAVLAIVLVLDLTSRFIGTDDELAAAIPVPVLSRRNRIDVAALLAADHRRVVVAGVQDDGSGARGTLALANSLVATGARVVIVDAGGRVTWLLHLDGRPGLAEALGAPDAPGVGALIVESGPGFAVLPHGRGELGRNDPKRAAQLLRSLTREADAVVVSAPAVATVAGCVAWGAAADGVVLAVRRDAVPDDAVRRAAEILARSDVTVLGSMLVRGARLARTWRPEEHPETAAPASDRLQELQA
jgi:capsular polysaccharide biosynthesis protein